MKELEIYIKTRQGHSIAATRFSHIHPNKKTLIISSATAVLQPYYKKFASYFASLGYLVYTFDYFGIGKSSSDIKSLKANTYNLVNWGQNDQAAMVAHAQQEHPEHEIILLTHSIGGQILGFNPNYLSIDKIVMVASQSGYWRLFQGWHRLKMGLFWHGLIPIFTPLFGYFPARLLGLFENLPKQMVYQWARWGKKSNYMMHYYDPKIYYFEKFEVPIYSFSFPKDHFAPKSTVDWLADQFKNAKVTRFHYPSEGKQPRHFGFFKEAFKELWDHTNEWILKN